MGLIYSRHSCWGEKVNKQLTLAYGHSNKNLLSVYPFLVCNVYKYGSVLHMLAGKKIMLQAMLPLVM